MSTAGIVRRYPENMETLTISNTCSMETKVAFCFQHDHNATTWLLDPPDMTLQPGRARWAGLVGLRMGHDMISVPFGIFTARLPSIQNLTVWAYPKSANSFEDALVCCVQHNPNPVVFKMNCEGWSLNSRWTPSCWTSRRSSCTGEAQSRTQACSTVTQSHTHDARVY